MNNWIIIFCIIFFLSCGLLLGWFLGIRHIKPIEDKNQEILELKNKLLDENNNLIKEINNLSQEIKKKEAKIYDLSQEENLFAQKIKEDKENWQIQIDKEQFELNSLKETRAAAIEALRKEKEAQSNYLFYTLELSPSEKNDIYLLEQLKGEFSQPRVISMLIWQNYYRPIATKKFPQILGTDKVCGIYKITNHLTGECYIGQSVDIKTRWNQHCKYALGIDCPTGNKLYSAMKKDKLENFTFELLEKCDSLKLNEKEKYYIDLFKSADIGYNSNKGNK